MRSILAGLRTLVLPWGAAPGIPRIVLGPSVPPELAAFYTGLSLTVTEAILFYVNATDYWYEANLQFASNVRIGRGFAINGTSVYETDQEQLNSAGSPGLTEFDYGVNTPGLVSFGSDGRVTAANEAVIFRSSTPVSVNGKLTTSGALTIGGTAVSTAITYNTGAGVAETWHALALLASWTNYGAPEALSQYRLIPSPAATVEVVVAAFGGTTTDGTTIATLPAGYRPTHTVHHSMATSVNGSRSCQLELTAAGNLIILGVGATGDLTGTAFFPLDA